MFSNLVLAFLLSGNENRYTFKDRLVFWYSSEEEDLVTHFFYSSAFLCFIFWLTAIDTIIFSSPFITSFIWLCQNLLLCEIFSDLMFFGGMMSSFYLGYFTVFSACRVICIKVMWRRRDAAIFFLNILREKLYFLCNKGTC